MISLCLFAGDVALEPLVETFKKLCPCESEVVIGDNSHDPEMTKRYKALADEYIHVSDKQIFRMGIPWAHNLVASIANTYKIFYIDSDEYPVWIHPDIEKMFDLSYALPALRADFFEMDAINDWIEKKYDYNTIVNTLNMMKEQKTIDISTQDRIYNCRYAQFNGVCHSVFHMPQYLRGRSAAAVLFHNKTVREDKNKERMDELIYEQYQRQNINPMMASSEVVLMWGKRIIEHRFKDWTEWDAL